MSAASDAAPTMRRPAEHERDVTSLVPGVAWVQTGGLDIVDADRRDDLRAGNTPCGTWWRGDVAVTVGVAGDSAVVVCHRPASGRPEVICVIEELVLAAARARMTPEPRPRTRLAAPPAQAGGAVHVTLWPDAVADHRGIHGDASWTALVNDVALRLDELARGCGGAAFEVDEGFALLVPPVRAKQVAYAADALVGSLGLGASVAVLACDAC
jgi:hypothetical protein